MKHLSTLFVLLLFALALTALGDDKPADKDTDNELEAKQQEWKEKLEAAKKTGKLELLFRNANFAPKDNPLLAYVFCNGGKCTVRCPLLEIIKEVHTAPPSAASCC